MHLLLDGYFDADRSLFLPGESGPISGAAKSLLVMTGSENILIDTGIGNIPTLPKYAELRKTLHIHRNNEQGIKRQLQKYGLTPRDISIVVNTHLHTAHSGNNPLFKNAKFFVSSGELHAVDDLVSEDPNQMSYVTENFAQERDLERVNGEYKLTEDVTLLPTPGHTLGHQSVIIDFKDYKLVYSGDVSPLKENFERKIAMSSVDPGKTLESMKRLKKIRNSRWIFSHDPNQLSLRSSYRFN